MSDEPEGSEMATMYWAVITWGDPAGTAQRREIDSVGPFDDERTAQEVRDTLLDAYRHLLVGHDFAAYVAETNVQGTPEERLWRT
ncbi:hypothetical protein [Caldinitratiruptor microaerophilus]|uniref:Uncharacterized protein n=1 Tax=Caldinitratiruptor microaerophilus TaxID=671077 RepID=A0AA35CI18_9FIRM|nr:hypothetical protein [Caldinitratiruptor microaerophilus]BDG59317.1 hypothetical protein caldi_04070 [Caldinitratiruptor microaerophilus]